MSGNATELFAGGTRATASIVNYCSSGGVAVSDIHANVNNNSREVLSGALTSATLSTVLSITGAGVIPYLAAYAKDTTSRTVRLVVIVDGTTAFDATSSSLGTSNRGLLAAGNLPSAAAAGGVAINFNSSCVVRVASSLTETDKLAIAYNLETKQ